MAYIDLLSESDFDMIEHYIDNFATSQRSVDAKYILREWSRAKEALAPIFGSNLILTKDIQFKRSREELTAGMNEVITYGGGAEFYQAFNEVCYRKRLSNDFLESDIGYQMEMFMSLDSLVDNVYNGSTLSIEEPEWEKPIKIQHGARITRILGKLAEAYNLPHFEDFRVAHGQVLNQKEMHGTLCLSIHPFDYMTMSDNANGWSSCMNWMNQGCYRHGTVEMMNSHRVVVAYLAASEPMYVSGGYQWNSKKWRELFIVDKNMISNVKSYPYHNENLTMAVMEWLRDMTAECNFGDYDTDIISYHPWDKELMINDVHINIDPCTGYMYNDFSDEREQFGIFNTTAVGSTESMFGYSIDYSGASECMACGKLNVEVNEEGDLEGECCHEGFYCDCCGDSYDDPDDLTMVDGEYLCNYCLENNCDEDIDGDLHRASNLITIHLADDNFISRYLTIRVFNENFDDPSYMKNLFTHVYRSSSNFYSCSTIFVRDIDCTEEGLRAFGYNGREDAARDVLDGRKEEYSLEKLESDDLSNLRWTFYWQDERDNTIRHADLTSSSNSAVDND